MLVTISGRIIEPADDRPRAGVTLVLSSVKNSSVVLKHAEYRCVTGGGGEYSFRAAPGEYDVSVSVYGSEPERVGKIRVYRDSKPGTLNEFLLTPGENDFTPDIIKLIAAMCKSALDSANDAKSSANEARKLTQACADLAKQVSVDKSEVTQSASAVATAKQEVVLLHEQVVSLHEQVALTADQVTQDKNTVAAASNRVHADAAQVEKDKQHIDSISADVKNQAELASQSASQALSAKEVVSKLAEEVSENVSLVSSSAAEVERNTQVVAGLANSVTQKHAEIVDKADVAVSAASEAERHAAEAGELKASALDAAQRADKAASDAEHAVADAMHAENALSEIASLGAPAQAKAQKNLGLGTAATQRVQASKYGGGREAVALAGSFGFGGYLENKDVITFTEQNTLLGWIKHAYPGRYLISQSGIQIVPGLNLNYATLEVIQSYLYNNSPTDKLLRLYSHSEVYTCAFRSYTGVGGSSDPGRLSNWKKTSPESLLDVLRSASGVWGDPGVGGLILAAYQGKAAGDKNIQLARGQAVSGSRLGQVGIEAGFGGSTFVSDARAYVANCTSYPLPGAYMALSGIPTATGDRAWIGLFMRYA
ncbi:MAG: prophage tail fiber N-terminal domain-containing protein [Plesiomonas shigelloides]